MWERVTEDAARVLAVILALEFCNLLFGTQTTMIGIVIALPILAWRLGLWPFPEPD